MWPARNDIWYLILVTRACPRNWMVHHSQNLMRQQWSKSKCQITLHASSFTFHVHQWIMGSLWPFADPWFKTRTWKARRCWEAKPPKSSLWARRPWCMWWWFTVGTMLPASGTHICVSWIRCCLICEWLNDLDCWPKSTCIPFAFACRFCMVLQGSLLCHYAYIYIYATICRWMNFGWKFFSTSNLFRSTMMPSIIPSLGFPTKIHHIGSKHHSTLTVWQNHSYVFYVKLPEGTWIDIIWYYGKNHEHWTLRFWARTLPGLGEAQQMCGPSQPRSDSLQTSGSPVLDTGWTAGPVEGHAVTAWGWATWSNVAIGSSKHFPGIVATWIFLFWKRVSTLDSETPLLNWGYYWNSRLSLFGE